MYVKFIIVFSLIYEQLKITKKHEIPISLITCGFCQKSSANKVSN